MVIDILIKNELKSLFRNITLHLISLISCLVIGIIIWLSPINIIDSNIASSTTIANVLYWVEIIIIPAIMIRGIYEEKGSGIQELLLTKPIRIREIVMAKVIATWLVVELFLSLFFTYNITISQLGNLDWGATISAFLALSLVAGLIISICLLVTSLNKSSYNGLLSTWIISIVLLELPAGIMQYARSSIYEKYLIRISIKDYFEHATQGLVYIHGLLFILLLITFFIILTCHFLIKRQQHPIKPLRYIITIHVIIVLCILSSFILARVDLSSNQKHSLSAITSQTIKENNIPIKINVFYTDNLPESSMRLLREFGMLLRSYKTESNAKFIINSIKINNTITKRYAESEGIMKMFMDDTKSRNDEGIYMGATITVGNEKTVIPYINYNTAIEYEITRTVKQASTVERPNVGMIYGHGEQRSIRTSLLSNEISKNADITYINLNYESYLNNFKVLCILGPTKYFSEEELYKLSEYLRQGGRLFIALQHAKGKFINPKNINYFTISRTGLEDFLEERGLKINYDFVIDNNCSSISIQQPNGTKYTTNNIRFPYFPIITKFSDHIITNGLNSMILPFASSMERIKTSTTYAYTSLANTSSLSGTEDTPILFNINKHWNRKNFNKPYRDIAVLLTCEDYNSAIIAVSCADFLQDDAIRLCGSDNINFATNAIEWLCDNSALIQLRNKYTTFPTLEELNKQEERMIKTINIAIPPILVILISFFTFIRVKIKEKEYYGL